MITLFVISPLCICGIPPPPEIAAISASGYQLGKGEKKLGQGEASICAKKFNFTLAELVTYAQYMRFTLDKFRANRVFADILLRL